MAVAAANSATIRKNTKESFIPIFAKYFLRCVLHPIVLSLKQFLSAYILEIYRFVIIGVLKINYYMHILTYVMILS